MAPAVATDPAETILVDPAPPGITAPAVNTTLAVANDR